MKTGLAFVAGAVVSPMVIVGAIIHVKPVRKQVSKTFAKILQGSFDKLASENPIMAREFADELYRKAGN